MIDHIGLNVSDYGRSKRFFAGALGPLGYTVVMEYEGWCGLGADGKPDLWIIEGEVGAPMHLAFRADSRAVVDAFYRAAVAAGGVDNGAPGLRRQYHPRYYAAFVLDFDGNNVEAVCHV